MGHYFIVDSFQNFFLRGSYVRLDPGDLLWPRTANRCAMACRSPLPQGKQQPQPGIARCVPGRPAENRGPWHPGWCSSARDSFKGLLARPGSGTRWGQAPARGGTEIVPDFRATVVQARGAPGRAASAAHFSRDGLEKKAQELTRRHDGACAEPVWPMVTIELNGPRGN